MRYGIALFPSKALQERVNSYRKRYDTHYSMIPPHITVKEPFELPDGEKDHMVAKLQAVKKGISPIHIVVNRISSFQPVNNVIYLRVEDDPALTVLHEHLHGPDFPDTKSYNFVPHITIAQDLSDIEHVDIYDRLKMIKFYHEETIHEFHLLFQKANGTWSIDQSFNLGGE
ncbi:MAG: 2'-5' RNA ligase family protein [Heyndrickxia sp.]